MSQLVAMELYFGKYASYKCCDCTIICLHAPLLIYKASGLLLTRRSDAEVVKSWPFLPNKVTYLLETQVLGLFALDESINVAIFCSSVHASMRF